MTTLNPKPSEDSQKLALELGKILMLGPSPENLEKALILSEKLNGAMTIEQSGEIIADDLLSKGREPGNGSTTNPNN